MLSRGGPGAYDGERSTEPALLLWGRLWMSTPVAAWMRRSFSDPRLRVYLTAANGDGVVAERLYWWNLEVSAAFYGPLHCLELGLRNALDRQLRSAYGRDAWWTAVRLTPVGHHMIAEARTRCAGRAEPWTSDDVVAQLSFGFWTSLLSNSRHSEYDRRLWVPTLHRAFPAYHGRRDRLHEKFETMRLFRNRIMHHEPIHHRDLAADHRKIFELIGYIDPASARAVALLDRVRAVLGSRAAAIDGSRPPCF